MSTRASFLHCSDALAKILIHSQHISVLVVAMVDVLKYQFFWFIRRDALAKHLVHSQYTEALVAVMVDVLKQPDTEVRTAAV